MHLSDLWFTAIAVLWAGYFLLEGLDFGVGIALPVLGRDDSDRRVLINTIGPAWDGNEVWLLTAGGAGVLAARLGREGRAFAGTGLAIVATTGTLFTALYPRVLPSPPAAHR